MSYCEDCGGKTSAGICSNCQEELYILTEQSDYIEKPIGDEFAVKAEEQRELLERRKHG